METEIQAAFKSVQDRVSKLTNGVDIQQSTFGQYYLPLIRKYVEDQSNKVGPYTIGFQGCQGIGKTVLTTLIECILVEMNFQVVRCSIDDYYCSYEERLVMSGRYIGNPFYQISRGMPGTHRYEELINMLQRAKRGESLKIPGFDKSLHGGNGDILEEVRNIEGRQDFIILEGWCVNIPSCNNEQFVQSVRRNDHVNEVFEGLDPEQEYFQIVLGYLSEYQKIWQLIDNTTLMLGEDIQWIAEWRIEQEERMKAVKGVGMSVAQIKEFIKPYIPFTWLYYDLELDTAADCALSIGRDHLPTALKI